MTKNWKLTIENYTCSCNYGFQREPIIQHHESLEECKKAFDERKSQLHQKGIYINCAYAHDPNGALIKISTTGGNQ